jgi:hypothetical protein
VRMAECNDCCCVCVDLAAVPRTTSMGNDCLCILLTCKTTQGSPTVCVMKRNTRKQKTSSQKTKLSYAFKATRKNSEQLPLAAAAPRRSSSSVAQRRGAAVRSYSGEGQLTSDGHGSRHAAHLPHHLDRALFGGSLMVQAACDLKATWVGSQEATWVSCSQEDFGVRFSPVTWASGRL